MKTFYDIIVRKLINQKLQELREEEVSVDENDIELEEKEKKTRKLSFRSKDSSHLDKKKSESSEEFNLDEENGDVVADVKASKRDVLGGGFRDYSIDQSIFKELNSTYKTVDQSGSKKYIHAKTLAANRSREHPHHRRRNSKQLMNSVSQLEYSPDSKTGSGGFNNRDRSPDLTLKLQEFASLQELNSMQPSDIQRFTSVFSTVPTEQPKYQMRSIMPIDQIQIDDFTEREARNPARAHRDEDLLEYDFLQKAKLELFDLEELEDSTSTPMTPIAMTGGSYHISHSGLEKKQSDQATTATGTTGTTVFFSDERALPHPQRFTFKQQTPAKVIASPTPVIAAHPEIKPEKKPSDAQPPAVAAAKVATQEQAPQPQKPSANSNIHNSTIFKEILPLPLQKHRVESPPIKSSSKQIIGNAKEILQSHSTYFSRLFTKKQKSVVLDEHGEEKKVKLPPLHLGSTRNINESKNLSNSRTMKSGAPKKRPPTGSSSKGGDSRPSPTEKQKNTNSLASKQGHDSIKEAIRSPEASSRALAENIDKLYKHLHIPVRPASPINKFSSQSSKVVRMESPELRSKQSIIKSQLTKADSLKVDPKVVTVSPTHPWMQIVRRRERSNSMEHILGERNDLISQQEGFSLSGSDPDTDGATAVTSKFKRGVVEERDCFQLRALDILTEMTVPTLLRIVKAIFSKNGLDPFVVH